MKLVLTLVFTFSIFGAAAGAEELPMDENTSVVNEDQVVPFGDPPPL